MGEDMWRVWFTKLLLLLALLLAVTLQTRAEDGETLNEDIKASRIERDVQGVTTVLLVSARPGKSVPPVGLLTKTARTFVQDGASTEFATQVLGTTLDNGRLYARILSTSSRVFYEKEPSPDPPSPYVVYPSRAPEDDWQLRVALDSAPIKAIKEIDSPRDRDENEDSSNESDAQDDSRRSSSRLDELTRENDIFNRKELSVDSQRFKPAKVRPADNLPTYTVKHEYITSTFDAFEDDQPKSYRPRLPKIFKPQPKVSTQKKIETKPLATVTYHGFADFTTTVGDTVIVFSPSTSPAPIGRPATTIKGDATLRPDDGVAVMKIRPTKVAAAAEKTVEPSSEEPGHMQSNSNDETGDQLLDIINRGNIQPSVTEEPEVESYTKSTEPLLLIPDVETGSLKPTGLLKVVDSTTSLDGTTTHYKSLIYGTYIGTNYAQIIHTSSNVYFFPDEVTATYDTEDTTLDYGTTGTEVEEGEQDTTMEMTTGTTPRIITTSEETPAEMNELTTPFKDTTDNVLTTLKDILESARRVLGTTESASAILDDEITNDILPGDPQGRSIKGGSLLNSFGNAEKKGHPVNEVDEKERSTITRLIPSTVYKTYTIYTTFFIPYDKDQTTESIRTNEVVSSEVTYLTELIVPSASKSTIHPTALTEPTPTTEKPVSFITESEEEQTTKQDEEIELIFKTLYTTYTFLTTSFHENTSSVFSREVVETNVITQTVGPDGVSAVIAGLFETDEPVLISPTKVSDSILPSVIHEQEENNEEEETERNPTTLAETTEGSLTTFQDQDTTINQNVPTEPGTTIDEFEEPKDPITEIEPSPTPEIPTQDVREQVKTYYTTYTYFTTMFDADETEIESSTHIVTNIVTETIQPTTVQPPTPSSSVPPGVLTFLEAIQKNKTQEEAFLLAKIAQMEAAQRAEEASKVLEATTETTTEFPTTIEDKPTPGNFFRAFEVNAQVTPNPPVDGEVLGSMITDVVSSSSSGGGTVLDIMDKRNAVPEDQELSESNHHEVEPAPTLLLQTSYTTFTYFTTMYKGDTSNVMSHLETVTNVVTETIRPTAVVPAETSTLPVTYFITFTYWTTYYRDGDTVTTSREKTVSSVVTPGVSATPTVDLGVIMTYTPTMSIGTDDPPDEKESKVTADNEVTASDVTTLETTTEKSENTTPGIITTIPADQIVVETIDVLPKPTTYYTTHTYYTTSYQGSETILNSRFETITSVHTPDVVMQHATGRAIGGPVYPPVQTLKTEEKPTITPSKVVEPPKTGLISTIRSSEVHESTTTHYTTDIYGTYIDGLYAQVVESSVRIETPPLTTSSIATPVLPTGVLSLNQGSVIDADEVTTVYFTTKQIGTYLDGLYAKVIESTSSTKIDEEKKASIPPTHGHRTGLVRLIKGQIENNGTTTIYQSKVIGTSIEGRYAQIIESTSSFYVPSPTTNIAPTSTSPPTKPTGVPEISPSPAVIQSSLSEDPTTESPDHEDDDESESNEEEEDEGEKDKDGQSSKKKSRLTFSTKKRTFTPVIKPFASRNRPTFNPKRKGAQAATTITRTDITPTITATLAGKGNRFASSRGRITSPIGPYSSTLSPSGSRRFSGRRGSPSTASSYSSSVPGSTRGRPQSRISPSSVFQGNRRGPTSIRGSSSRGVPRGSSSIYPGASSRYRPGIRPSSTLLRGQPTVRHDDQENDANEFTTTTLITDETAYTEEVDGGETVTAPLQTTTESSRRSTNPLLRFRRPLNYNGAARSVATPRPTTTIKRSGNLSRSSSPTVPRVTSTRTNSRTVAPISTRPRQSNTGLFPPRGLFGRKQELPTEEIEPNEDFDGEEEENFENEPVEEIEDNDYEGSEHEDRTSLSTVNRRSGKALRPTVQIRSFGVRSRRVRRQASQLRSLTNRFRRPSSTKSEDKSESTDSIHSKEETGKSVTKPVSRYNNRARTLTTSRPSSKSANSPEKTSAESSESNLSHSKSRVRVKQPNGNSSSRIKPSPTSSNGRQFTLREKDSSSTSRSSYKRPTSGSRTSPRTSSKSSDSGRVRPPRLRNTQTESSTNSRRLPPSRASSRSSSRNSSSRRGSSQRGRGSSHEDIRESPTVYPDFDGTITVTHYVPTEVTIPVVNNGITEHRNIITAQPSTQILGPSQYSTVTGGDGRPLVVIVSEVTGTNLQGQTEVTRFLLHETPTTRISHTLTTLGGRRASQSVIIPSTVYSVENVVSTIQPSLPGNAPLANILLSQLLLGQLGQPNPLLQSQGTPTTQYNTRTTSYVTTITKHQSTVIPLTFRGKEILTTLVDSSTDVVTATEFITDTVVVTPTAALPAANLNSLLLLLQQPQPQTQNANPLLDPLFAAAPFTQSNTLPGEVERRHQPADSDYRQDSYEYSEEEDEVENYHKPSRSRNGRGRSNERKEDHSSGVKGESSVVTLYVSGRRPGEFSTVLSTVKIGETASASRKRRDTVEENFVEVRPSIPPSLHAGSETVAILTGSEDSIDSHAPTQSLESVVGDYDDEYIEQADVNINGEAIVDGSSMNDDFTSRETTFAEDIEDRHKEAPRKRVRIRVPVRRNGRQHKVTVVRRRPVSSRYQELLLAETSHHTPRRIVVTRVRPLGLANSIHGSDPSQDHENFQPEIGRHKVTITRRRKIQPTPLVPSTTTRQRVRITRKKLIAVRPVQPTPTFAIITTGFFTAPSAEYEEDYTAEDEEEDTRTTESSTLTPNLEETPNLIDNKPNDEDDENYTPEEIETKLPGTTTSEALVIITDNFFFPPSDDEEEDEYEDDYPETTTTITPENVTESTSTSKIHDDVTDSDETSEDVTNDVSSKHDTSSESKEEPISTTTTEKTSVSSNTSDITTEAYVSKEDDKSEEIVTTTSQQEDIETSSEEITSTTESQNVSETSKEDTSTIEEVEENRSETEEETSDEIDKVVESTTSIVETTTPEVDTTTINVTEELPETTTKKEIVITTEAIEHTTSSTTEITKSEEKDDSKEFSLEDTKDSDRKEDTTTETTTITETNEENVTEAVSLEDTEEGMKNVEVPRNTTDSVEENILTVQPIQPTVDSYSHSISSSAVDIIQSSIDETMPSFASVLPLETSMSSDSTSSVYSDDIDIPSVIPLDIEYSSISSSSIPEISVIDTTSPITKVTTSISSPTPEDIEAGLADDLYLSLSRPDFPEILPSRPTSVESETKSTENLALEPSTSVYYTETVVTSTRLRTYTYVVTQLNGQETKVTSSTTVRPRVTTLTLTVPVTVTITPTVESSANSVSSVYNPVSVVENESRDEEGRRFNLATRVMSNGVEVIVAGPTPALRWENSIPQPTLTLSDTVVMMLPQDKPNEFVTKTCTTTFTYLSTITKDGTTTVSTEQQVVANTATEERHRKPGSETAAVTLEASPTLRTEVFKTTYTYLTLNTDHPNVEDALESSTKVITNTVTAPQHYLDMILEPSEAPRPETNTYFSTRLLEKTFMEEGRTRIETTSDTITQLIVTESAPPPRPTSVTTTLTALDNTEGTLTDVMKTYYITYTYHNTFLEKGSTVVRTNIATSTDVFLDKVPVKKTTTKSSLVNPTPEPIQIFATKTYLTTFTYFTTLLQAGPDGETSTTVSSRSDIVENVVTESIAPSLLDAGYMNALLTTAHHSDPVKNVVTGSTIIFFDEEDQIDPTTTTSFQETSTMAESQKQETISPSFISTVSVETSSLNGGTSSKPVEQVNQDNNVTAAISGDVPQNKRPTTQSGSDLQVSNLLTLGSLGINGLSALGPVITAMAGLLQGKTTATRRNDTVLPIESQEVTTQRSPIYIPVAEFADGDIETAESQHIGAHLANLNHNYISETRHKVASNLADGIPISPGEVITANSDVIIGKPGKMAPRPPQTFLNEEEHIGMKPPPLPVPNIPVHPVLEVLDSDHADSQAQQTVQGHKGLQLQILPAHQVYEEHLKIPVSMPHDASSSLGSQQPQKLHPVQTGPPKRIGSKQGILENDPLLKPPDRPNVEQYANPNINLKVQEWKRPWSAKDPLTPPPAPPRFDQKIYSGKPAADKQWPILSTSEEQKRHPWAQKDPLLLDASIAIQTSESKPTQSEPIVHQVPHVIDRSTGQPLLVNIQPSQVANVVIPQGGTQALIFGDTSEPHISGQYFDDPSPYPEPEVGLGFVGIQSVEDLPQYSKEKDPAEYMVPPSPPLNFKPLSEKTGSAVRPTAISLSPVRFDYTKTQDKVENYSGRPEKKPSEVHLIKRPDNSGALSGQGHLHTEILVHHRPETVNIRPQAVPHPPVLSHVHPGYQLPSRGQPSKVQKPNDGNIPPRRTEVPTNPSEVPHRYIFLGKPDTGNEIGLNTNWKSEKKPSRIIFNNRLRPRPLPRPTTSRPLDRPIYVERPNEYNIRQPVFTLPQITVTKPQNTFVLSHRPTNSQSHREPPQKPTDVVKEIVTERPSIFGHHYQIDLQDRPPQFYPEKTETSSVPTIDSQTVRNEEHVPTGAVEYHNPSNPKIKPDDSNKYYAQSSTAKPQTLDHAMPQMDEDSNIWQVNVQSEKTLLDSDVGASEHVKYHDELKKGTKNESVRDDSKIMNSPTKNFTANVNDSHGNVMSVNTVVGKPFETIQNSTYGQKEKTSWLSQGVPFAHKNEDLSIQGTYYRPDLYNSRPYDLPVMQGKPFGVYNGQMDPNIPYGYKQKDSRPEYEIVQGVPSNYYGDKKPSFIHKNQPKEQISTVKPSYVRDDTIDLKPPAITPPFVSELDRPSRPYPRPHSVNRPDTRPIIYPRPELVTKLPGSFDIKSENVDKRPTDARPGIPKPFVNQTLNHGNKLRPLMTEDYVKDQDRMNWNHGVTVMKPHQPREPDPTKQESQNSKDEIMQSDSGNNTMIASSNGESFDYSRPIVVKESSVTSRPTIPHFSQGSITRVHPEYPHILTKPKPPVPGPITISTGSTETQNRPNMKFSMSVEAMGEDVDRKTQTERPPSMLITKNNSNNNKKNEESLDTAYQTNFATSKTDENSSKDHASRIKIRPVDTSNQDILNNVNVPSGDMMPPPLRPTISPNQSSKSDQEDLKPPPLPSHDVVGLSPPPLDITTTGRPIENLFGLVIANQTNLKSSHKYIPLKESSIAPLPSVTMVPPSPRPSLTRPFLVELLSQDMVPPPPVTKTTRPLEIATVRPAVAVSGSIQIATAVATSHIPVVQDIESKIPIIHGTVDLPIVVDVPEILRPVETRMTEHVSIYTVRPFDTKPVSRVSVQPTMIQSTTLVIPTKVRTPQVEHVQPSRTSTTSREVEPTRTHILEIPPNPVKRPEQPVFLESSYENVLPSTRVEPTESLTHVLSTSQRKEPWPTMSKSGITKVTGSQTTGVKQKNETSVKDLPTVVTRVDSSITKATGTLAKNSIDDRRNESTIKTTKSIAGSETREVVKNKSTVLHTKPKEVTRFKTSTVTRTETSVLGSPPTTRTLLLTHTLTSTTVETVTETLLRPTSVVATVTSTILQSVVTRIPSTYENTVDNDSIFVVISDHKPPEPAAGEMDAEYGEVAISRDEQDPAGNEIHRVLAGDVLGASVVSLQPVINQCIPDCKTSKAEVCAEVAGEMRCVCRPGFARMFPDRPCRPTYTYTLRIGLDRIGRESLNYEVALNDSTSPAYKRVIGPTKDALDRTLMQSDLRDIYRGLRIAGFTPNPTKVEFHVQLSDNANETRLKEVLRKYLVGSNYSLGGTEVYASKNLDTIDAVDFDECASEEGGPHHDCSPNAACFNLRGSYQCSCKEGWADLSENQIYPGRICSQAPLGCSSCNNKGHCVTNTLGQEVCECFPWHSGQRCQVNLKVLLIALVTTGAILLGLLVVCVGMACFRHPSRKRKTGDRRAMIPGTGGDTSSEGSVTDLAIPHHVPHVLPPPPPMIAPLPPTKRPACKISGKPRHPPRKATMMPASVPINSDEQRDRSLTVMIPRAKYRSAPQSPQNYKSAMSTFSTEEHKLINYLDNGTHNTGNRRQSISSIKDCKEADLQVARTQSTPTGALVSAGFQVSATVTRNMDAESTLARSCGETTVEPATKVLRSGDLQTDLGSTLARSCGETTIQAPTKLLRLDLGEAGSTLARSCGETTIQPPTKVAATRRNSVKDSRDNRDTRDSASEGHTMAERDLGSTLRLPAQHPPLYSPDRTSDRESNFDSL